MRKMRIKEKENDFIEFNRTHLQERNYVNCHSSNTYTEVSKISKQSSKMKCQKLRKM